MRHLRKYDITPSLALLLSLLLQYLREGFRLLATLLLEILGNSCTRIATASRRNAYRMNQGVSVGAC